MLKYTSLLCFLLVLLSCKNGQENASGSAPDVDLALDSITGPKVIAIMQSTDSLKPYVPRTEIDPYYLTSDFTGDGLADCVVLTKNNSDNENYLIFFHSEGKHFLIGGGEGMKDGDLTLEWVTGIEVFTERETFQTIIDEETGDILGTANIALKQDAVGLKYGDSGTIGILYWDGTNYTYIHQFD